jgi:hypothetical protein
MSSIADHPAAYEGPIASDQMLLMRRPMARMPTKLKMKEIGMNIRVLILVKPNMLTASSSGSGEEMMRPPRRNVSHLK